MKVIEILKLGQNIAKALHNSCIKLSDFKYIEMYDEYMEITASGEKSTYAVALLSEKYNISERQPPYNTRGDASRHERCRRMDVRLWLNR